MNFKIAVIGILLLSTQSNAEYQTTFKRADARSYLQAAEGDTKSVISELSTIAFESLKDQAQHLNTYEREKFIRKINQHYGTNLTIEDLIGESNLANNKHQPIIDKVTYQRIKNTQSIANETGKLGADFAKDLNTGEYNFNKILNDLKN